MSDRRSSVRAQLRARKPSKLAEIAASVPRPIVRRGFAEADATPMGALSAEVFRSAYARALADGTNEPFVEHVDVAMNAVTDLVCSSRRQQIKPDRTRSVRTRRGEHARRQAGVPSADVPDG